MELNGNNQIRYLLSFWGRYIDKEILSPDFFWQKRLLEGRDGSHQDGEKNDQGWFFEWEKLGSYQEKQFTLLCLASRNASLLPSVDSHMFPICPIFKWQCLLWLLCAGPVIVYLSVMKDDLNTDYQTIRTMSGPRREADRGLRDSPYRTEWRDQIGLCINFFEKR